MKQHLLPVDAPVRGRDRFGQMLGGASYMYAYVLFSGLAMYFFTDVFGLPAEAVGTMMMVATIWDGINDPLMGLLIDKTHTKWGKARPYILIGSIAVAITTVMTFSVPAIESETGKLVYAYVAYILMGMSLTVMNMSVPILITRITRDPVKTANMNSWSYAGITAVSIFASLTMMKYLGIFAGEEGNMVIAYQRLGILAGAMSLVGGVAAALLIRERDFDSIADGEVKTHTVGEYVRAVLQNRYYLILICGVVLFMAFYTLTSSTHLYYVTYNLGNSDLYSYLATMDYAGPVIGILTITWLVQHFDKKKIVIAALLMVAAGALLRLFTGDRSVVTMLIFAAITYIGVGLFSLNATPMLIDTAQYGQAKTGVDASGLIISSFTLAQKIGAGLATGIFGQLLGKAGYDGSAAVQPDSALNLIKGANIGCLAAAALLSAVIIAVFYKLDSKKMDEVRAQLEQK